MLPPIQQVADTREDLRGEKPPQSPNWQHSSQFIRTCTSAQNDSDFCRASDANQSSSLLRYDGDSPTCLDHRVLDLIDALEALQLSRGSENVALIHALLTHYFLVHLAVLDQEQRNTIEDLLHPLRPLL